MRKARRPTLAAWAVNQLALDGRLDAVLAVGVDLRRAQQRALSGVRAADLRAVADRRRDLVDRLTAEAAERLRAAGYAAETHLDAIRGTLLAASTDEEAARQVAAGRLAKELPASSGFGELSILQLVPEPLEPEVEAERTEEEVGALGARGVEAQAEARAEARAALEALLGQLDAAEDALRAAMASATTRTKEYERAVSDTERLERELDAARHHTTALRRDAERAADAATRARRTVDGLRERVEDARGQLA